MIYTPAPPAVSQRSEHLHWEERGYEYGMIPWQLASLWRDEATLELEPIYTCFVSPKSPHTCTSVESVCSAGSEASLPPGANITCHEELTKYHGIATSRLSKKGCDDFFGTSPKVPPGLKVGSHICDN